MKISTSNTNFVMIVLIFTAILKINKNNLKTYPFGIKIAQIVNKVLLQLRFLTKKYNKFEFYNPNEAQEN